jgi:heat shock protein HslJ
MKNTSLYLVVALVVLAGVAVWFLSRGGAESDAVTPPTDENGVDISLPQGEDPSVALTDHTWVWLRTVMNDGTITEPVQEGAFTLSFTPEGTVGGRTDCNSFSGEYTLDDTTLSTGPFAMTLMYCEGSQETEFIDMVSGAQFVFFTDAGDLVLLLPYDSGSVIFAKES